MSGALRPAAGPEHNLIQRPDLTKALRDRMGLRQAHIAPTLDENVQPVIVVDDLNTTPSATRSFCAAATVTHPQSSPARNGLSGVWCPSPGRRVRVLEVTMYAWDPIGGSTFPVDMFKSTRSMYVDVSGSRPPQETGSGTCTALDSRAELATTAQYFDGTNTAAYGLPDFDFFAHWSMLGGGSPATYRPEHLIVNPGEAVFVYLDKSYASASVYCNWLLAEESIGG